VAAPVQHRPILDVRSPPHDDRPEVGAQHGPVPDGRLRLDAHVPDQGGGGRDPRRRADFRLMALKGKQWHPPMMPRRGGLTAAGTLMPRSAHGLPPIWRHSAPSAAARDPPTPSAAAGDPPLRALRPVMRPPRGPWPRDPPTPSRPGPGLN